MSSGAALPPSPFIPPPPRAPSPRARKLVFSFHAGQQVLLMVGGVFAIVGACLTLVFAWNLPEDLALSAAGRPMTAVVRKVLLDEQSTVNGRHPTEVVFEYGVDGQTLFGSSTTADEALTSGLAEGSPVEIEYLPSRPRWARVRGTTKNFFGYLGAFMVLLPLVGVALVLGAVRAYRRTTRAFVWGQPVVARKVSFAQDSAVTVNRSRLWRLVWEFRVEGRSYRGSVSLFSQDELADFFTREEVPVLYLPEDPSVNALYLE